jgi:hypothetical protein
VIAEHLSAQLLSGPPATSPEAVVHQLLAVQAQDPRGARLSVRSRTAGLSARDVDDALTERRSMVVTWANRGTLHLVSAEDYWWLHPLTTPQLTTGNRRRLGQEGVSAAQAARGVEVVTDAVGLHGPRTRHELRQLLNAAGVPTAGQALVHVLLAATLAGRVVRGPMRGAEQAFVAVRDWLGDPPEPLARGDGLARLARRYLVGHGPADAGDLARWAGLTVGDARAAFGAIAEELEPAPGGLLDLVGRPPAAPVPPPRLLGPFDPLLLGWASRARFVGSHTVVTTNGIFRPFALVDGRVVATWGLAGGTLTVRLLEPVAPADLDALRADADDVVRFLDLPGSPRLDIEPW